jgi:branched-chain amino acid transport system substrate-binding protein
MKKVFALLTVVVILTAALAACGGTKATCPEGDVCVTVAKDEPIRVGYMMVVSGDNASLGQDTKYGAEIAIDDKGSTLLGHKIELIGEDTLCSAEGGQTAAQKLSADPKLVAVNGTNCSSAARAAIPVMCAASIPMVSPSNTAPDLTAEDRPADYWCYLRTAHNDTVQGAAMANYAWEKGFKKAATCHDGSLYADKLQQVFAEQFTKLGGTITAQEAVAPTDTDMKPMLTRVAATAPEFFYYPIFIAAGGQITSQARQVPGMENVQLAGADGIFSPDFLKAAGDAVMGPPPFVWSSPDFSLFGAGYGDFLNKYETKYGTKVLAPFHAHSYDAMNIIFAGIEKVAIQNSDGSLIIPRKALAQAMLSTKDFTGITGNLTCTATGDCADPKIAVYQAMSADPATWNPGAAADSNPMKIWP